jgi:putative FmdB family regulatory protein
MPTYEYECTKCGHVFEVFQSITAKPLKTGCEKCKDNVPIRRRISAGAGVIFKGSGFYETDYRSESYKKAAKAEKEAATGTSDKKDKDKSAHAGSKDTKTKASDNGSSTPSAGGKSGKE